MQTAFTNSVGYEATPLPQKNKPKKFAQNDQPPKKSKIKRSAGFPLM